MISGLGISSPLQLVTEGKEKDSESPVPREDPDDDLQFRYRHLTSTSASNGELRFRSRAGDTHLDYSLEISHKEEQEKKVNYNSNVLGISLLFFLQSSSWRRILLLIVAVTIHNIPEGLAVGVGFGAVGRSTSATFQSARNLALGIGIQNFPEGIAVSLPLKAAGFSTARAIW